jgi:hypothetical protein
VTLVWDDTADAGRGGTYDLARGSTLDFPLDGSDASSCIAAGLALTRAEDTAIPGEAEASWYLVRGNTTCVPGTWGRQGEQGVATLERDVAACP